MRVQLDYGKTGLDVELPDDRVAGLLQTQDAERLADPPAAIRAAIADPIGTRPLSELAHGKRTALVPTAQAQGLFLWRVFY